MILKTIKTFAMISLLGLLLILITSPLVACDTYNHQTWSSWKSEYDQDITGESGWLSLVGLYWLNEGSNTLGSAKDNLHQLPNGSPDYLGVLEVKNGQVHFSSLSSQVLINGKSLKVSQLSVDKRTLVSFANFEFYIIKREKGFAVRLINNQSEKRTNFTGTRFLPFSQDWVLKAKLITPKTPQILKVPTVYGTIREHNSAGWLEFEIDGKTHQLQAVDYGKDTPLYIMFSDPSNSRTTYGAGRYIEVEWPDKSGNTVLDFNRAYNPPCAFTSFATCPLTPRGNRLEVIIKAGELDVLNHE